MTSQINISRAGRIQVQVYIFEFNKIRLICRSPRILLTNQLIGQAPCAVRCN